MQATDNLYNARLKKVSWFVKRFGAAELVRKPLRMIFSPLILRLLPGGSFRFQDQELAYLYHPYNMTWATERCVEVPIARWFASACAETDILEVGNVLSHYGPVKHDIIDKFEKGPGVINQDILDFHPEKRYRLILSISTFEHIGFDDDAAGNSAEKIRAAVKSTQLLLAPGGKLVTTVPIGYNPDLDKVIKAGQFGASRETFLERSSAREWQPSNKDAALRRSYRRPFPYANAILVAEFRPEPGPDTVK